jgi:hypothetical protein
VNFRGFNLLIVNHKGQDAGSRFASMLSRNREDRSSAVMAARGCYGQRALCRCLSPYVSMSGGIDALCRSKVMAEQGVIGTSPFKWARTAATVLAG